MREYFRVSNYRRCIQNSENYFTVTKKAMEVRERLQITIPHKEMILANAKELSDWTEKMKEENYHDLYVSAFIGMWSSFESGLENVVADFVENERTVAESVAADQKRAGFDMAAWPWSKDRCLEGAKGAEQHVNRTTKSAWWDTFSKIRNRFRYIGVDVALDEKLQCDLAEANLVRNVLLHRYGKVSQADAEQFPELSPWIGVVVPFTNDRFSRYYTATNGVVLALLKAIAAVHCKK